MEEILNIGTKVIFDESLSHYEVHALQPYGSSSYNNNDEIRISVQHQDLYVLPSKSTLMIYGKLTKPDGTVTKHTNLVNNALCHLFEEICYELNAVEIERMKNVGLTSAMKAYVSLNSNQSALMENAGWVMRDNVKITDDRGNFNVSIPLSFIFGFAEDYRNVIVNAKHELILIRANTDVNAITQAADEQYKITINRMEWFMPYVRVSDVHKVRLLKFISMDPPIQVAYRCRELYEMPLVSQSTKIVWTVKTSTQLEKPRYVIIGFQTARKNAVQKNSSEFDQCNLRDVKLFQTHSVIRI